MISIDGYDGRFWLHKEIHKTRAEWDREQEWNGACINNPTMAHGKKSELNQQKLLQ